MRLQFTSCLAMLSVKLLGGKSVVAFQLGATASRGQNSLRFMASVTGIAYSSDKADAPTIKLFTKEGCTLCDKVKATLIELRDEYPHALEQVDITDEENKEWFSKYKYDIPVLHIDDKYWIKHRINVEEAKLGISEALEGTFTARGGEPDAGAMEKRQAEREKK